MTPMDQDRRAANRGETSELMRLLDIEFDELGPTRVAGSIAADDRHHQPWGLAHGGLYTTVIETFATTGAYEAVRNRGQPVVDVTNITDGRRPHRSRAVGRARDPGTPGSLPAAVAG